MFNLKRNRMPQSPWCSASREDLQAAVQCLTENGIHYMGPFVIKPGIAVFKVSEYLMTADELVALCKAGHLTREGLTRLASDVDAAEMHVVSEPRR